jgi:ribosomal protein S18 acetylase RimI-like enzyme
MRRAAARGRGKYPYPPSGGGDPWLAHTNGTHPVESHPGSRVRSTASSPASAIPMAPKGSRISPTIRPARATDLAQIIALDAEVTGLPKHHYWRNLFARDVRRQRAPPFFLVAAEGESDASVLGFILGEVRTWEFGSIPCGWVYAVSVHPSARQRGLGAALLDAIALKFRQSGVSKLRTMVAWDNRLLLLYFRAAGMTTGPYLELAKDLGDNPSVPGGTASMELGGA